MCERRREGREEREERGKKGGEGGGKIGREKREGEREGGKRCEGEQEKRGTCMQVTRFASMV